ncbi:MAG: hypothetical protein GX051_04545 [Clostridiales bacterium]|nr:hypothetical protein [Clostridiales bacterium]
MSRKTAITYKEIFAYSFGLFGLQLTIGYINTYIAQFYNKTMGAQLATVGLIMLAAKLISAFADPFIGGLIDRSRFKNGKLRPFILISSVPFFLLSFFMYFVVPLRGVALYGYMFLTFTLWSIAMSLADIPSQGMLSVLTPDPAERNKVAGFANVLKNAGASACCVIMPVICVITRSENGAITKKEFLIGAAVMAVIGCALFSLIYFFNREAVTYRSNSFRMKEIIPYLKGNKPLMLVFLSSLLGFGRSIGFGIQAQASHVLIGTVHVGGITIGGENMILLLGITTAVTSTASMMLMPAITKRLNEKKTFILMSVYGGVTGTIAYLVYASGHNSVGAMLLCLFFTGFMYGSHSFLPMVMVADSVDYYEYKTGKRAEGVCFAVLSLGIKIATALSVAAGLIIVGLSGYDANAEEFATHTKNIIYAAYVLVPGMASLLSMIPIFFYNIVGTQKRDMIRALRRRHLQTNDSTGVCNVEEN